MTRHDRNGVRRRVGGVVMAVAAALLWGRSATAQIPTPRPPVDPARTMEAARVAYDALPLAERIDIQDGLVWSGVYTGALDGTFGRMTFEAIAAFQSRNRLAPDGILTAAARKALADAAKAKKATLGFQAVDDKATGVRIHLPTKLLGPAQKGPKGTGWVGREGRIRVDTYATPDVDLPGLYEQMKAEAPGRRITYAVLRPDWFVISEETGNLHRYARFVRGAEGIRGFFFTLDASLATELDRVVIATAGRFEPFPGGGGVVAGASPAGAAAATGMATASGGAAPAAGTMPPAVVTTAASGLVVAPGRVLTAAAAIAGCRSVTVAGRPVTVAVADAGGIATLAGGDGPSGAVRTAVPAEGPTTVVAAGDGGGRTAIVAVPGEARDGRVRAALQRGGQGAPVIDARGAVIGLVLDRPDEGRAVAGTIAAATYGVSAAGSLDAAVAAAGGTTEAATTGEALTTGRAIAGWGGRVVAVECRR